MPDKNDQYNKHQPLLVQYKQQSNPLLSITIILQEWQKQADYIIKSTQTGINRKNILFAL